MNAIRSRILTEAPCDTRTDDDLLDEWLTQQAASRPRHPGPSESGQSLISVTLAGGNREGRIGRALDSVVPFCDAHLLLDTGESAQKAIEVVCSRDDMEGRAHVARYTGETFDTAKARTQALHAASSLGYSWAIMLDTDEQISLRPGFDVREYLFSLVAPDVSVVMANVSGGVYPKERFFRLPITGEYPNKKGEFDSHETYVDGKQWGLTQDVFFDEDPKTEEELDTLQNAVAANCIKAINAGENVSRSWMYLGNTQIHFKKWGTALESFKRAAHHSHRPDELGWCWYRAATCAIELGLYDTAIECAVEGMRWCPMFPELPWVAAYVEWRKGDHLRALAWANMTIAIGNTSPLINVKMARVGFQNPVTAFEGGWEIRRNSLASLGLGEQAAEADSEVQKAKEVRARVLGKCEGE